MARTKQRQKRTKVENERSSAPKRARQDSVLNLEGLPFSASDLKIRDIELLKVSFRQASTENAVIPNVEVTNIPDEYVLAGIDRLLLRSPDFAVDDLEEISDDNVRTFIDKLHDITEDSIEAMATSETTHLVDDLLRIVKLNTWPLKIKNRPPCQLCIEDKPYVSSEPEFVVKKKQKFAIIVNKHLKSVGADTGFGESQIAAEILSCGSENIRSLGREQRPDQTLWAIRVISTYVTFYKAEISAMYWAELENGLPQEQNIEIQRWPAENGLMTGFDLAEPNGRTSVLMALAKIRKSL